MNDLGNTEIEKRFSYHPPHGDQGERYKAIRNKAKEFAYMLVVDCPASRELSLALTNLDQVVMMANAAIARNEPSPVASEVSPTL
ncbi:MAG: hypothetical protein LUC93_18295 [Planctomycetaceae bacterium]|nr:hypothetical protein [Planctomycetaceae bacterium]